MLFEKNGKFFERLEVEREIDEINYLKKKIRELEERVTRLEMTSTSVGLIGTVPYQSVSGSSTSMYIPQEFPVVNST